MLRECCILVLLLNTDICTAKQVPRILCDGLTRLHSCRICSLKQLLQALRLQSECKQAVCERTAADLETVLCKVGLRAVNIGSQTTCFFGAEAVLFTGF